MTHEIEVFTSNTCHFCHDLKDFLHEHKITFTETNVQDESSRNRLIEMSGQLGVPVTVIDNTDVVVGFNKKKLSELLGIQ